AIAAGAIHVYRVSVVADVPVDLPPDDADCVPGAPGDGSGFLNTATVTHNGEPVDDEACAEAPSIAIDKALVGAPVANGDGTYTITYDVEVTNAGGAATTYDLDDALSYGAGITVVS